jgi:hypothetical protein
MTLNNLRKQPRENLAQSQANDTGPNVDAAHFQPLGTWSSEKLNESRRQNPFMMTWVPGSARHKVPNMTHGEGVYLYDDTGKQYLDWTSQAGKNFVRFLLLLFLLARVVFFHHIRL